MEKVLAVPTAQIRLLLQQKTFDEEAVSDVLALLAKEHIYLDRAYAEHAEEYKQIIPYAVLTDGKRLFLTRRLKAQTEKRLHGKFSIGLGGHINPSEENTADVVWEGMKRELYEEVGLTEIYDRTIVGVLDDFSTDVGKYHVGVVYFLRVSPDVQVKETRKMSGKWASCEEIDEIYGQLESWSQIVWDHKDAWLKVRCD